MQAKSQSALAKEVGVPQPTLSRWLREAKRRGMPNDKKRRTTKRWTLEEKLRVVLDAAAAGESGFGALLRREGVHEADLTRFRAEVQEAALDGLRRKSARPGPSAEDKRPKALEKELRREEKALAEAAPTHASARGRVACGPPSALRAREARVLLRHA